jgi:hypothetical protein
VLVVLHDVVGSEHGRLCNGVDKICRVDGNPYCENSDSNDDAQRCYCTQYCYVTPGNTEYHS